MKINQWQYCYRVETQAGGCYIVFQAPNTQSAINQINNLLEMTGSIDRVISAKIISQNIFCVKQKTDG